MSEHERALRAARSFARNQELLPKAEERLAKARSKLAAYLLRAGTTVLRLGRYRIELLDGELHVSPAPPDGWEQAELEGLRPASGVAPPERSGR